MVDQREKRRLTEAEIEQLRELVRERAEHMTEADLREILGHQAEIETKLRRVAGRLPQLHRQVRAGMGMVRDYWKGEYRQIPFWSVASVAAALGYFLTPTDMIPDFLPFVGYLDDATVMAAVMAGLRQDLKRYCEFKGLTLDE